MRKLFFIHSYSYFRVFQSIKYTFMNINSLYKGGSLKGIAVKLLEIQYVIDLF